MQGLKINKSIFFLSTHLIKLILIMIIIIIIVIIMIIIKIIIIVVITLVTLTIMIITIRIIKIVITTVLIIVVLHGCPSGEPLHIVYNPSSHIKVNLSNQQRFFLLILKFTLIWISFLGAYFVDDLEIL